ncbi:DUF6503 family protein [uncultured Algibacter sp.]|uniref:DUF6503 family protein n=1 Tax=uncultured Algibacter sp. TaxID=298659 RepID=UPI002638319C|nr:DUF6503 family protein [uncultured Algibacter sp.]
MKKTLFLISVISIFCCKNKTTPTVDYSEENLDVTTSIYPENITKIFDAHGGLDVWNTMKLTEFTIERANGNEVTTTNIKNRKSLIEMPKHTLGFNGKDVWLQSKDSTAFKENPRFYYNLMFYFYAMPFVLADDGIIYKDTNPLVFEGKTYPGIKISYDAGVGESPDDEYVLYYDAETYKMVWLSYTVTYFSKEKSKTFKFIKYSNWETIDGLLLPETLTWYKYENNMPTVKASDLKFIDAKLSKEKPDSEIFEVPEGATLVE